MTEPSQSRWSSSTESRSGTCESEQAPEHSVEMLEGNVLSRIRRACSPPKKNNFQTLEASSAIDLTLTPAPAVLLNVASETSELAGANSNVSTFPSQSGRRPSLSRRRHSLSNHRRLSQPIPKPKPARRATPNSKSKPKSPPTTPPPSNFGQGCSFELTPLSGLIAQSFTDISLLRRLHEAQNPTYPSPAYSPKSPPNEKHKTPTSPQVQQSQIDFDKVEENLKKFEELYRQFLNYGGKFGDKAEEVHLVAVVCKKSDVVKGQMGAVDGSVPRVKKVWVDCGF